MTEAGRIAFNLAVNATGSFVIAAGLCWLAARLVKPRPGRWSQALLVLPLVKVVYDIARGIPGDRFFWQTLAGARQDLGTFRVGLGVDGAIPLVHLSLGARVGKAAWSQSLAEPLASWLVLRVSPHAPSTLAAALLTVSALLLALRSARAARSLWRAHELRAEAVTVATVALGRRTVSVVVSPLHGGAPFAGGWLRPFVCFSPEVFASLDEEERAAVVGHELGHLQHHDLAAFAALALVADVLWFVPGLRARCRTLRAHAEIAADDVALARGAAPLALASALVRVGELCARASDPSQALSLIAGAEPASSFERRVQALLSAPLGSPARTRHAWAFAVLRVAAIGWTLAVVLRAATLGNH